MGLIALILKGKAPKHKPLPLRGIELFFMAVIEQAQPAIIKKAQYYVSGFKLWVEDGIRTHDLLNHNQAF